MGLFPKTETRIDLDQAARDHYADVWRFCARQVGEDRASDAAQETFVIAHRKRDRYRSDASVKTWLFGIALNCCRNLARKHRLETPIDWIEDQGVPNTEGGLITREALRCALLKLSAEHREAVLLHEIEGFGYGEIAGLLGIPEGTVKSRLHHAFAQLRKHLGGEQ